MIVFLFFLMAGAANAQDCMITKESITKIRAPIFGDSTLWEYVYGDEGYEDFIDIVPAHIAQDENEAYVLAGHYTKKEQDTYRPFFLKMDNRGKIIWKKKRDTIQNQSIIKLRRTQNGYLALSNITKNKNKIGLTFLSKNGNIIKQASIFERGINTHGTDIVSTHDGKSFLISGYTNKEKSEAILYQVSQNGDIQWKRQYKPGLDNGFESISRTNNNSYIIGGKIKQEDDRHTGWLLEVNSTGAILWQRQFPRGKNATLQQVHSIEGNKKSPQKGYIALGHSTPNNGSSQGIWIMQTDEIGNIQWQRYYQSADKIKGLNFVKSKDGLIQLVTSAFPQKDNQSSKTAYTSILTISPRGYLMNIENYTANEGIFPFKMIKNSSGALTIAGRSQTNQPNDGGKAFKPALYDAWLFSTPAHESYKDPCTP